MSTVLVPVVSAILIALAVMPLRDWVRDRMPGALRWLGTLSAMLALLASLAMLFGTGWMAAQQMLAQVPEEATEQLTEAVQSVVAESSEDDDGSEEAGDSLPLGVPSDATEAVEAEGLLDILSNASGDLAGKAFDMISGILASVATTIVGSTLSIGAALVMILFLTLLILLESEKWRKKVETITTERGEWRLLASAGVISQKMRQYLLIRSVLGLITGGLYGLWLWFFGTDLILVWAVLSFVLNFIPVIGAIIAGVLPVIYVFATKDFGTAVIVGMGILVIEQILGNYVDPKLSGDRVAVSPLVVLAGLLFWSWLWGIPGALLAAPVTVALVVVGAHVPVLRPWALLLSDRTDMAKLNEATRKK